MLLKLTLPAFVRSFSGSLLGCVIVLSACNPHLDSKSSIFATRSETLTNKPTNSNVDSNSKTTDIVWDLAYGYLELIDADNQEILNEFIAQSNETKLQALRSSWLVTNMIDNLGQINVSLSN